MSSGFRDRMRDLHDQQRAARDEQQRDAREQQLARHQERHRKAEERLRARHAEWQAALEARIQATQERFQAMHDRMHGQAPARGAARDLLIAEAADRFLARGFADVSMQEIADAVGVTKAAMYYHFASKEQLFEVVMQRVIADFWRGIGDAAAAPGSFRTVLANIVTHAQESLSDFSFTMLEDVQRHCSPEAQQRILHEHPTPERDLQGLFRRAVAAGEMRPLDVELVAALFLALIFSLGRHHHTTRTPQPGDAEVLIDIFLHGIVTPMGAA